MSERVKILVADDEEIMRDVLHDLLAGENYIVDLAQAGSQALAMIRDNTYDVMLLDLLMPDMDGLEVLQKLQDLEDKPAVIVLTAFATLEKAVKATKLGAFDFIAKPFKNDEILLAVRNALEQRRLRVENLFLKRSLHARYSFKNIIGKGAAMQQVFQLISQVAPSRSTVLIHGESGTGKELAAKAIHASSPRSDAPFMTINCGNIPSELLESELFGHVRGAFTGAASSKKGLFEAADGGSLFLDEVATLSMEMQAKLLRVIQEREFRRLGGLENIKVDVRIIAATNRDLQEAVRQGAFRDDLFYRINVIAIKLPPLRERTEDIPLLVDHFIKKYSAENNKDTPAIEPSAMKALMDYDWPGNVRELENVVERAIVLSTGKPVAVDLFPKNLTAGFSPGAPACMSAEPLPLKERVSGYEKSLILAALETTRWNQKKAAELLLVNTTTLSEKLKRLRIRER
jgi:DNA-binding NtrC family response regulator